jgi:pyruvate dehydrogenase E2 component (dihydrolipoamide acetyltransferase)
MSEFKLPELGENIQGGNVVNVLVSEGDTIKKDDPVLEIETDKATIEVPSAVAGVIKTIHVKSGDKVEVGQVILTTGDGAEEAGPSQPVAQQTEAAPAPEAEAAIGGIAAPSQRAAQQAEAAPEAEAATGGIAAPSINETPLRRPPETPAPPSITEFHLPDLGENIQAGTVVNLLVATGDTVAEGQGVLEIETDKATIEVPSSMEGTVKAIHVNIGDKVSVGQSILTLETAAAPAKTEAAPAVTPQPSTPPAEPKAEAPSQPPAPSRPAMEPALVTRDLPMRADRTDVPAAPNVRRIAREIGVDVTEISGTGPAGRLTLDDVKRHANETLRALREGSAVTLAAVSLPDFSQWGEVERQPMSNIRQATAEHVTLAWTTIPHVTQFDKADITELEQLRKRFSDRVEKAGGKLTITAILLKVLVAALKEFPKFNASIDMKSKEIILKHYYHIGIAVDTERGLLVPVIRNADQKNIIELAVELGEVAEKARNRKLGLEDMRGGTFSITNLGGIGGPNITPIVNTPEVAILGVARGGMEPVYQDGQFEPRLMLPLSLSYDHRLIDGADAARFLRWVAQALESPFMLALQGW